MTDSSAASGVTRDASPPPPTAKAVRIGLLVAAVAAIAVIAVGAGTILGGPERHVETGIVVDVQATSLTRVEGFSIRTADGRTVAFRVTSLENAATFPPGHLAEHKVSFAPVRVTWIDDGGTPRAVSIQDAK